MLSKGELLSSLLTKEKAEGVQAKVATAKEDWKNFHANLHQKESALEVQHPPARPQHTLQCWAVVLGKNGLFLCSTGFPSILVIPFCIGTGSQTIKDGLSTGSRYSPEGLDGFLNGGYCHRHIYAHLCRKSQLHT